MTSRVMAAAKKTAGIRGKRITGKQRVARVKNIAVARKHRSKGSKGGSAKKTAGISMKEAVNRQLGRRSNTAANRKVARKELNKAIKTDKAKMARRKANDPAAYSKAKSARKKRDMATMKASAKTKATAKSMGYDKRISVKTKRAKSIYKKEFTASYTSKQNKGKSRAKRISLAHKNALKWSTGTSTFRRMSEGGGRRDTWRVPSGAYKPRRR